MPDARPQAGPRRRPASYLRSGLYATPQLPGPDTEVGQVLAERRANLVADLRGIEACSTAQVAMVDVIVQSWALLGDQTMCQVLKAPSQSRRCSVSWLVEAETVGSRRVTCTDGDPACDADGDLGQCTFLTALCTSSDCEGTPLRIARPSRSDARRWPDLGAVRGALGQAVHRGLAPGRCTEAAPLVVPAGHTVELQARTGRRATRAIRLTYRAQ